MNKRNKAAIPTAAEALTRPKVLAESGPSLQAIPAELIKNIDYHLPLSDIVSLRKMCRSLFRPLILIWSPVLRGVYFPKLKKFKFNGGDTFHQTLDIMAFLQKNRRTLVSLELPKLSFAFEDRWSKFLVIIAEELELQNFDFRDFQGCFGSSYNDCTLVGRYCSSSLRKHNEEEDSPWGGRGDSSRNICRDSELGCRQSVQ